MLELVQNPAVQEILKTSGPASLLAMMGWAAWWYERKQNVEKDRRIFKMQSLQVQANTRIESAMRAMRELIRERL